MRANAIRWSLSSKLWYRLWFGRKEARFDGNLNNGNPIVAQTHSLVESQSQLYPCIVHVATRSRVPRIRKIKFMTFKCGLYCRKWKTWYQYYKRGIDFNNELNIFAKLLILRELLQIIEKFRIMCYYSWKIFSC